MPWKADDRPSGPPLRDQLRKVVKDGKWDSDTSAQIGILEGYVVADLEIIQDALADLVKAAKLSQANAEAWGRWASNFARAEIPKLDELLRQYRRLFIAQKVTAPMGRESKEMTLYALVLRVKEDSILAMDVDALG